MDAVTAISTGLMALRRSSSPTLLKYARRHDPQEGSTDATDSSSPTLLKYARRYSPGSGSAGYPGTAGYPELSWVLWNPVEPWHGGVQ